MAFKDTKLYSITKNKCPHCHEGAFFNHNNPYNLTNFYKMDNSCKVCGEKYTREPGFFFGAMFISYALNVAWFVAAWVATLIFIPEEENILLIASIIIGFGLVMAPLTYRLSRLIWINMFVHYESVTSKYESEELNTINKK
jgi:uncharacterized protein (DUF983 family)